MGKKLDALLGRNFKASKFRTYVNLAISRIAFLEKQHRVRCQQARSDVVQLLNLSQKERALLRVEHVIREQNMLDAYVMIENYFNLLMERIVILKNNKFVTLQCPDELKEAISSLIFAAPRCGELPELQKIRGLFTSRYGKELETCAVELRNNCGVNPKIVKKLSTRRPSLGSKLKMLKEVAPMHDISNLFEGGSSWIFDKKIDADKQQRQHEGKPQISANLENAKLEDANQNLAFKMKLYEKSSERKNARKKYRDAESAAEAAYKFAADAAEAARAAVQLARPHQNDPNFPSSSTQETNVSDVNESSKFRRKTDGSATWKENKKGNTGHDPYQMNARGILSSKQGGGEISDNKNNSHHEESEERYKITELEKLLHGLSLESSNGNFTAPLKCQEKLSLEKNSSSLQKAQADKVKHTLEGKSNMVNSYNKDFSEKSGPNRPSFGRKPHSVRTRRSYRMRSM
ncbi:IST1-like protein [Durio zibethinus]|uniref:IST1-like protein n=1 Tax=Durio zibethinus TaxID=66656 RepID=A0A6P6AXN9_DURZI|nr:IST1-like protein [Durio zibethinus]